MSVLIRLKKIKIWRNRKFIGFFIKNIEKFYLLLKFQNEIYKTRKYLALHWTSFNSPKLPLTEITKLILPNTGYTLHSPTIILVDGIIKVFARMSNSTFIPASDLFGSRRQKIYATNLINGTCQFDFFRNKKIANFRILIAPSKVPNFEDPRVFRIRDRLALLGTYVVKESSGLDRRWITKSAIYFIDSGEYLIIESPYGKSIEKNWVPLKIEGDILSLVYQSRPMVILEINLIDKSVKKKEKNIDLEFNFNGGSQFIRLANGNYLRIVRKLWAFPKLGFIHISYAIIYNENLDVIRTSSPFIFRKLGLEICHGLILKEDQLIFSWAEDETDIYIGEIPISIFLSWVDSCKTRAGSPINLRQMRDK